MDYPFIDKVAISEHNGETRVNTHNKCHTESDNHKVPLKKEWIRNLITKSLLLIHLWVVHTWRLLVSAGFYLFFSCKHARWMLFSAARVMSTDFLICI